MVAQVFHFYAGAVDKHGGETIPVAGGVAATFREPLGVVGLIVPWNFPANIASWKLGPALACGNTVVLKPAELTPLSALRLGELCLEAGIPEGVVNVLVGKGSLVGQRLIEHPDVAKIAFTGSTEVGRLVMAGRGGDDQARDARAGRQVGQRRLRGRRPRARRGGGAVRRLRQRGSGLLRTLAHPRPEIRLRRIPRILDRRRATRSRSGDPSLEETEMGPLISAAEHRETVASFVDGVPRLSRAKPPNEPGYWYPCTVVEATNDDRVAREEVFGPVAAVIPFDDEADAIRISNDTPYGLSGSIWTRDGSRALRVARATDAGVLSVNANTSVRVQTPFGGFKQSGFGRELGMHALDGYSEIKSVFISTED